MTTPIFKMAFNRMSFVGKPTDIDWATFNKSFVNVERRLDEICNAIYLGHPFCPWMKGIRKKENFVLAQHVGIDMDSQDYRSTLDSLAEHPLVKRYGALIYPTPSCTHSAPKHRVLFLLDEAITNPSGYYLAVQTLYSLFDGSDPACIDESRFFYGNGALAARHDVHAIWFDKEPGFPLSDLRVLARRFQQEERRREKLRANSEERSSGDARQMRRRFGEDGEKPSLSEIGSKLESVNAYAIDYRWWFKVITALKNEYGDGAYELARRWSSAPGKDDLSEKKWNGIHGNRARPATLGTIYKVIQEFGVNTQGSTA